MARTFGTDNGPICKHCKVSTIYSYEAWAVKEHSTKQEWWFTATCAGCHTQERPNHKLGTQNPTAIRLRKAHEHARATEPKLQIVARYLAGWWGEYGKGHKLSGFHSVEAVLDQCAEGCVVLDKSDVDPKIGVRLVMSGPMLDVSLPPQTVDKFGDQKALEEMLPGLQDGFRTMAVAVLKGLSSFDSVSLDIYVAMWRNAGAKVGKVVNGAVVWE